MATKAMLTQNSLALEAQLEERPLAKKQEALQGASKDSKPSEEQPISGQEIKEALDANAQEVHDTPPFKVEKVLRKALLKNDDTELERVAKVYFLTFTASLLLISKYVSYSKKFIIASSKHTTSA